MVSKLYTTRKTFETRKKNKKEIKILNIKDIKILSQRIYFNSKIAKVEKTLDYKL